MNKFSINWKVKSFIYKIIFFFKVQNLLFFIQKKITKTATFEILEPAIIENSWKYHLRNLQSYNSHEVLEFGGGKSLEQNIFLSHQFNNKLKQTVIDEAKMLDIGLFNEASAQVSKILKTERKLPISSINEIKKNYNINYIAPCSFKKVIEKNLIFDACISTATLEHFSKSDLDNAFENLKKIIKKDGIISATIDYSDHYNHTDKKIGDLNFLKYNEKSWKKYNTPYMFQNRLRHNNFRDFFLKMNYEIVEENKGPIGTPPETISKEFDENNEETFILWGQFLLKNIFIN